MSQIEQNFSRFLSKRPEIEKCYAQGLINRRALARHLIKQGAAKHSDLDALIAMLRRYDFKKNLGNDLGIFKDIRISIKDSIAICVYEKTEQNVTSISRLSEKTALTKGETLKVVVGSLNLKVFLDEKNLRNISRPDEVIRGISELSIVFGNEATEKKGILSYLTRELSNNDIVISEFLTASPELLIYLKEEYVIKAHEILKDLKNH
jgi:hypothetical protein